MSDLNFYVQRNTIARLEEQLTKQNQTLERPETTKHALGMSYAGDPLDDNENDAPFATYDDSFSATGSSDPDLADKVEAYFQKGVALCQAGKMNEAVQEWRQVLALQPDNTFALVNIGIVLTEQSCWSEAREMFSRALHVQPESAEAHYGLGMAEAQLGNYAGAIIAWEHTLRLQPHNADARYNLALVREKAAQRDAAAAAAEAKAGREPRRKSRQESPLRMHEPDRQPENNDVEPTLRNPFEAEPTLRNPFDSESTLRNPFDTVAPAETSPSEPPARTETAPIAAQAAPVAAQEASVAMQAVPQRSVNVPRRPDARPLRWGGGILAAGAVCAALLYLNHVQSKPKAQPIKSDGLIPASAPAVSSPAGSETPAGALPQPAIAEAEPAIVLEAADHRSSDTARAGKMQIRLGSGLSGHFRYWFFSDANPTVRMHALPAADSRGVVSIPIPPEYNYPGAQLRLLNVNQGKVAKIPAVDVSRNMLLTNPNVGPNLLKNPDFAQGQQGWTLEMSSGGRGALTFKDGLATPTGVRGRVAHFEISAVGQQKWNVQCLQRGLTFQEGTPYLLSFWAKAGQNRLLSLDAILDKPDWHQVARFPNVNLTTQWQKVLIPFKVVHVQPGHTQLAFLMGDRTGSWDLSGLSVRVRSGADTSTVVKPGAIVTISAGDFN